LNQTGKDINGFPRELCLCSAEASDRVARHLDVL
jgi:hypothetical protein